MKTRVCAFKGHVVAGEDVDLMGVQVTGIGFVCHQHQAAAERAVEREERRNRA